jgi:hypothetical protein
VKNAFGAGQNQIDLAIGEVFWIDVVDRGADVLRLRMIRGVRLDRQRPMIDRSDDFDAARLLGSRRRSARTAE